MGIIKHYMGKSVAFVLAIIHRCPGHCGSPLSFCRGRFSSQAVTSRSRHLTPPNTASERGNLSALIHFHIVEYVNPVSSRTAVLVNRRSFSSICLSIKSSLLSMTLVKRLNNNNNQNYTILDEEKREKWRCNLCLFAELRKSMLSDSTIKPETTSTNPNRDNHGHLGPG